jgi:DNA polymerase
VPGDGPKKPRLVAIGEKPGREEDGAVIPRPFIGDAGREFNYHYLGLAGLEREDIYLTNTVKCRLGGNNDKPTPEQISVCAKHHLARELAELELVEGVPVVLMGATACSLVPGIDLDKDHGIPMWIAKSDHDGVFGDWEGWCWPFYHPASGLHNTSMMIPLMEDFERLGMWMKGKLRGVGDQYPGVVYEEIQTPEDFLNACYSSDGPYSYLPIDTEDDLGTPWSVQFSPEPGYGYLIDAKNKPVLNLLHDLINSCYSGIWLLNAPHDLDVLERMGIRVQGWQDLMSKAYHIGGMRQGLKINARRLCGVQMRSWDDLVTPYTKQALVGWMQERWMEEGERQIRTEMQLKTKVKVVWKPNERERDLKRILSHSHKPTYDPWEKLKDAGFEGYPKKSIALVPREEAVEYGCKVADLTGRVGLELVKIKQDLMNGFFRVDEGDWDQ